MSNQFNKERITVLIPKSAFCVSQAINPKDPRLTLLGVHVVANNRRCTVEATDGKVALRARWGTLETLPAPHEEIVPQKLWNMAGKEAPAPGSDKVAMAALSPTTPQNITEFRIGPAVVLADQRIDAKFPNLDSVFPPHSDDTHNDLTLDPKLLIKLSRAALAAGATVISFRVPKQPTHPDSNQLSVPIPLSFDGSDDVRIEGLIMPIKVSNLNGHDEDGEAESQVEEQSEVEVGAE